MERKFYLERILSVACEGFGADYYRITYADGYVRFAREASSSFDWDELDMKECDFCKTYKSFKLFDNFEGCWAECTTGYGWFHLAYLDIHEDYKEWIIEQVNAARTEARKTMKVDTNDDVERVLKLRAANSNSKLDSLFYNRANRKTI